MLGETRFPQKKKPLPANSKIKWLFASALVFLLFFAKKASQVVVKLKSELLDQKSLTSPTCFDFKIFDHDPQLNIKFLKP